MALSSPVNDALIGLCGRSREVAEQKLTSENRQEPRYRTIFRVAEVEWSDQVGLCLIRNMSDHGLMLSIDQPAQVGDILHVRLTRTITLSGRVIWEEGGLCGMELDQPINSLATLGAIAEERRSADYRRPRLNVSLPGIAISERGTHAIRATNLSQHGIGLDHDGEFEQGMRVTVVLKDGEERRGIVRWAHEGHAGVLLIDPLPVSDLNRYLKSKPA